MKEKTAQSHRQSEIRNVRDTGLCEKGEHKPTLKAKDDIILCISITLNKVKWNNISIAQQKIQVFDGFTNPL